MPATLRSCLLIAGVLNCVVNCATAAAICSDFTNMLRSASSDLAPVARKIDALSTQIDATVEQYQELRAAWKSSAIGKGVIKIIRDVLEKPDISFVALPMGLGVTGVSILAYSLA